MKLATFKQAERTSWGVVEGDEIADVGAVLAGRFPDLTALIAANAYAEAARAAKEALRYQTNAIEWLPVIPAPEKILCVGLNYETHRQETGRAKVDHPTIFARFANSQTGHLQEIALPRVSTALDYEGELAVIIGKSGRYISRGQALSYVAGYACYNDATLRDWQNHSHQFTPGKNFPGTGAFGPWMVTPDEVPDISVLRLTTRVNGTVVQDAGLDQLIFDIGKLIEYCSSFTRLEPGDVLATGTPGGVGSRRNPPLYLKLGDRVEVEISQIGKLSNIVGKERDN